MATTAELLAKLRDAIPPTTLADVVRNTEPIWRIPEFCLGLFDKYPGRDFVFFERDAIPFMWIMEEYRGPFTEPRLRSLYLNRRMISDGLGRLLPDETEEGTPENYRKRHSLITEYARSPGCEQHLAVRFVRQELAEAREGTVLVDFAYWGTMPVFVQALMPAKRFEVAWFIGPPGSPARFHHNSSEGPANSGERFIILDYRADRLVEENGMITPERLSEPGSAEFHEKRTALIEYALEWRATRSSTATNK